MRKLLVTLIVTLLTASWVCAQDADSTSTKSKSEVRTLTGCLTQGDSADEFLLTTTDGSTWEMRSNSTADLSSHLNQQVSITGAVSNTAAHNLKEDAKDAAADTGVKKSSNEHGHLKPTEVNKVSDSCQK